MATKEAKTREALLEKTKGELDRIMACTRKTKYSKEIRAGKVVNKYKMGKFVIFEGSGEDLAYRLNEEKIAQESALDGCYVIYTDVSEDDMCTQEVVSVYKSLMGVEQAFRNMKTVQLELRPVFHKKDDRIKCHAFICMLAYYVLWHMKRRLSPLFEENGKGALRKYTIDYVIEVLKCIRKETVEFCSATSSVITVPTDEQRHILELLGVSI